MAKNAEEFENPKSLEALCACSGAVKILYIEVLQQKGKQTFRKWVLPSHHPEGTKVNKNKALRTPFSKSGSNSVLKIEIDDSAIQAIEFLISDESRNRWFKNNGGNFHVKLPLKEKLISSVSVPEDLVQIQAYLRWERNVKQMYNPEQEKEYEAARSELLEEVARGTSIQEIRARLMKKNDSDDTKEPSHTNSKKIPEDLVQIQAYIRWEKAGKPKYSPDQQLREFEEARNELQMELDKGASLDEIRNKITKGKIKTKVTKHLQVKKDFSIERIQCQKRDLMHILNKYEAKPVDEKVLSKPRDLTTVELLAKEKEEQDGKPVLNKSIYKLDNKELLVFVTKHSGKTGFPGYRF